MKRVSLLFVYVTLQACAILASGCVRSGPAPTSDESDSPTKPAAQAGSTTAVGETAVPGGFKNLQILPEDISREELMSRMKLIAKSLGAKCNFCHRTDTRDYASDELEKKVIARQMMRMVERLNHEEFTWKGAPQATCFLCHRGEHKPQLQPE